MSVSFEQLPGEAKVWVYQSTAPFNDDHRSIISSFSEVFLSQWESHGIPVQGSIDILDGLFIRIAAFTDEPSMCGRAQDAQVRLIKELEGELELELMNRMNFAFELSGPTVVHMNEVEERVASGEIQPGTVYYNNLVRSKLDFEQNWKQQAADSWLARYF